MGAIKPVVFVYWLAGSQPKPITIAATCWTEEHIECYWLSWLDSQARVRRMMSSDKATRELSIEELVAPLRPKLRR